MHNDGKQSTVMLDYIRKIMRQSSVGSIPFHKYMELCLYHPDYGYYTRPGEKLGRSGDFYTSAHLGTIMGEVLANYCALLDEQAGCPSTLYIAEWGGGDGRLAEALLEALRSAHAHVYKRLRYISIERSSVHRSQQSDRLQAFADRCTWITEAEWLGESDKPYTIVLANELLDAFPVRRLRAGEHGYEEMWVSWDEEHQVLDREWKPLKDEAILERLHTWGVNWMPLQQFELHEQSLDWIHSVVQSLSAGSLILLDYGDGNDELYSAHRMAGTFLCYKRHQAADLPFAWPGEQDMTSHVPFDQCQEAAEEAGLRQVKVVTQKQFLVDNGILEKLQAHAGIDPFSEAARRNRSIRQLLISDGMSELFKVMTAVK